MRQIFAIIIVFMLTCAFTKDNVNNVLFDRYYKQIPLCKLPVSFDCFEDSIYTKYSNNIIDNDSLINRFQPQGSKIFGRLKTNKDLVSIIYLIAADFYYPTVFTFKLDGTPIDTLCLYSGESCDSYPEHWTRNIAIVEKDNSFTLIDTAGTYKLDTVSWTRINGSDSIVVNRYRYQMNKFGHFDLINSSKTDKQKKK